MTRQETIEYLTPKLTKVIKGWVEELTESADGENHMTQMNYTGDSLYRLMAKAAMSVWESSADVQDYLMSQNLMKELGC